MPYGRPGTYPYPRDLDDLQHVKQYLGDLYKSLIENDYRGEYMIDRKPSADLKDLFVRPEWYGAKGDGTTDDTTAFQAAVTAAASKTIVLSGDYSLTSNTTIGATVNTVFLNGSSLVMSAGITVTINGTVEAGEYQIFSGTGVVSFGANSIKEVFVDWWYSGSGSYDTALSAAITATLTGSGGIRVILAPAMTITGSISIPLYTKLWGPYGSGHGTSGHNCVITHAPEADDVDLFVVGTTPFSYSNGIEFHNFFIKTATSDHYTRTAIALRGAIAGRFDNIAVYGPATKAHIVLDTCVACDFSKIHLTNLNTTQATPAALLMENTYDCCTGISVNDLHVGGNKQATGGITSGIEIDADTIIHGCFYTPFIEYVQEYAVKIHKGNQVDFISPHIDECPYSNGAYSQFRIARDSTDAVRDTTVNIWGGATIGPVGTYTDVVAVDVGRAHIVNVIGMISTRASKFLTAADTLTTTKIFLNGCNDSNSCASFDTPTYPYILTLGNSNRFAYFPAQHRTGSTYANIPPYHRHIGQAFFATDHLTNGAPRWWNGTAWVDANGCLTPFGTPTFTSVTSTNATFGATNSETVESYFDIYDNAAEEVSNGSFTSNTTGWTATRSTLASVAGGQSGNCLEITYTTGPTNSSAHQDITGLTPGATYNVSGYVKSGTSGDDPYAINIYDDNLQDILLTLSGNTSSSWVQDTDSFVNPAGNTGIRAYLIKNNTDAGTMLFDEISITMAYDTSLADGYQQYSADIAAGNAAPHFRTEAGDVVKLYKQVLAADLKETYATPELDTEAEVIAALNATNAKINDLITALQNTGLLSAT